MADGFDGFTASEEIAVESEVAADVERAALACVLCDDGGAHRALARMTRFCTAEDFAGAHHGAIWRAFLATSSHGDGPDAASVADRLDADGENAAASYLFATLARLVADPSRCEAYARKVAEHAHRREVQAKVGRAYQRLRGKGQPLDVVSDARAILAEIPATVRGQRDDSLSAAMTEAMTEIRDAVKLKRSGQSACARWGVGALDGYSVPGIGWSDGLLGGLFPGKLYVLGGTPAAGKTTLAMQATLATARGTAKSKGRRVLFFSLEMRRADLAKRLVGQLCGIAENRIEQGALHDDEVNALDLAASEFAALPVEIIEDCRAVEMIRARVLAECACGAEDPALYPALVVVDFLQRTKTERHYRDENRADEDRVYDLKGVANDGKVPVLAITSMTKAAQREAKTGEVDQTSAKGSGSEYAADVMAFLVRTNPDDKAPVVEVQFVTVKRRGGDLREPPSLLFNRPRGLFGSPDPDARRKDHAPAMRVPQGRDAQ